MKRLQKLVDTPLCFPWGCRTALDAHDIHPDSGRRSLGPEGRRNRRGVEVGEEFRPECGNCPAAFPRAEHGRSRGSRVAFKSPPLRRLLSLSVVPQSLCAGRAETKCERTYQSEGSKNRRGVEGHVWQPDGVQRPRAERRPSTQASGFERRPPQYGPDTKPESWRQAGIKPGRRFLLPSEQSSHRKTLSPAVATPFLDVSSRFM